MRAYVYLGLYLFRSSFLTGISNRPQAQVSTNLKVTSSPMPSMYP